MATETILLTVYPKTLSATIAPTNTSVSFSGGMFNAKRTYNSWYDSVTISLPEEARPDNDADLNITSIKIVDSKVNCWRTASTNLEEQLSTYPYQTQLSYLCSQKSENATFSTMSEAQTYIHASKKVSVSNIAVEIEYEVGGGGGETIIDKTFYYNLSQNSAANGETITLTGRFVPNKNIDVNALTATIYNETANADLITFDLNPTSIMAMGATYYFTASATVNNLSTNYLTGNKIKFQISGVDIDFTVEDYPNEYEDNDINNGPITDFKLLQSRVAPNFTNLTYSWGSTTTFYSSIGNPTLTISGIQLDSQIETEIDEIELSLSRTLTGGTTENNINYSIVSSSITYNNSIATAVFTFSPFIVTSIVDEMIKLTGLSIVDTYDQTANINNISEDTGITIRPYTPLAFGSDFSVRRGYLNELTGNIEIGSLGQDLVVEGSIIKTSNINATLVFVYEDEELIYEITLSGSDNFVTKTILFPLDAPTFYTENNYTITVTLKDTVNTTGIIKTFDISKSSGYFNIEKGGVAVGGVAHGTLTDRQFECYYPMYLYFNGVKYQVTLGANNVLTAVQIGGGGDTPSGGGDEPTISDSVFWNKDVGGAVNNNVLSYPSSNSIISWQQNAAVGTGKNASYGWGNVLFDANVITLSHGSGTSEARLCLMGSSSTITIPSNAQYLKIAASNIVTGANDGNYSYVMTGLLTLSELTHLTLPNTNYTTKSDGSFLNAIKITQASVSEAEYTIPLSSTVLSNLTNYYLIIAYNMPSYLTAGTITIDKVWFE